MFPLNKFCISINDSGMHSVIQYMSLASLATEKGGGFTYFFDPQNPESQKLPKEVVAQFSVQLYLYYRRQKQIKRGA